mmetsp:Transcript_139193/g.242254  ORF Transcript_139193/g.242254 Transcript_139193/m.242254 type:complete len:278 (+) Transcript_139193:145-978(+)
MPHPLPLPLLFTAAHFLWLLPTCCDAAGVESSALNGVARGRLRAQSSQLRTGQMPADYDDRDSSQETHEVQLAVLDKLGEEIEGMRKQLRFLGKTLLPHGDHVQEDQASTSASDVEAARQFNQVASELMASERSMTLLANHSHKKAARDVQGAAAAEDSGPPISEEEAADDKVEPNMEDAVEEEPLGEDEAPIEQETGVERDARERALRKRMLEAKRAREAEQLTKRDIEDVSNDENLESELEQSQEEGGGLAFEDESPASAASSDSRQLVDLAAAA